MLIPDTLPVNGWVKYFNDDTYEVGTDQDVAAGKASWRKGRLKDMVGASIHVNGTGAFLFSDEVTDFWHSDDYESSMSNQQVRRITRRIQRKLGSKDWKTLEIDQETREIKELTLRHKV